MVSCHNLYHGPNSLESWTFDGVFETPRQIADGVFLTFQKGMVQANDVTAAIQGCASSLFSSFV